jgi:hypothetical protein
LSLTFESHWGSEEQSSSSMLPANYLHRIIPY